MEELLRLLMGTPLGTPGLDPLRVRSFILEELHRINHLLLRGALSSPAATPAPPANATAVPPQGDEVAALLSRARMLLLQHPRATLAATPLRFALG